MRSILMNFAIMIAFFNTFAGGGSVGDNCKQGSLCLDSECDSTLWCDTTQSPLCRCASEVLELNMSGDSVSSPERVLGASTAPWFDVYNFYGILIAKRRKSFQGLLQGFYVIRFNNGAKKILLY